MSAPRPVSRPVPELVPAAAARAVSRTASRAVSRLAPGPARHVSALGGRGFGLIEVLIALVVVSFGVLGMAGLQLTGMRHSAGGLERAKALLFAENMAARMRINAPGVAAGGYEDFDSDAWGGSCAVAPSPYCQASVGSGGNVIAAERCDTDELAAFDLWSVVCGDRGVDGSGAAVGKGVVDTLPNGHLQIDCDAADCAVYTVTVRWSENDARAAAGTPAASKRVQLRLRP